MAEGRLVIFQDHRTGEVLYTKRLPAHAVAELLAPLPHSDAQIAVIGCCESCDGESLVMQVEPMGGVCDQGTSCYQGTHGRHQSMLNALDALIGDRVETPTGGWTDRLLANADLRYAKIREEAEEVILAAEGNTAALAHEVADLWYHSLVAARAEGVSLSEILAQFAQRHGGRN